jgi:hypothetical protein
MSKVRIQIDCEIVSNEQVPDGRHVIKLTPSPESKLAGADKFNFNGELSIESPRKIRFFEAFTPGKSILISVDFERSDVPRSASSG